MLWYRIVSVWTLLSPSVYEIRVAHIYGKCLYLYLNDLISNSSFQPLKNESFSCNLKHNDLELNMLNYFYVLFKNVFKLVAEFKPLWFILIEYIQKSFWFEKPFCGWWSAGGVTPRGILILWPWPFNENVLQLFKFPTFCLVIVKCQNCVNVGHFKALKQQ